ncbi:MAG: hemerythrin domain-containing protein [Burkholderiales bacterium]|nr:hemerythrin domain-containing protein [Burkholderiales bacterium]
MASSGTLWQNEHANFARLLDLLIAEVDRFHAGDTPNYDLMLDIMFYMIHYSDVVHHPREGLVFARIRQRDDSVAPLLDELDRQHEELHRLGGALVTGLGDVINGTVVPRESIEAPARHYAATFRNHMQTEDKALLPLIRRWLDARDWAAIDLAIRHVEDPLFGRNPERHFAALEARLRRQGSAQP